MTDIQGYFQELFEYIFIPAMVLFIVTIIVLSYVARKEYERSDNKEQREWQRKRCMASLIKLFVLALVVIIALLLAILKKYYL